MLQRELGRCWETSSLLANFIPISQHFSIIKLADSLVLISTCLLCLASFVKHLYIKKAFSFQVLTHLGARASDDDCDECEMLIVRIRSVKIAAKYVQQAMGRRQNAEDEAEKKICAEK